jgi:nitrite reductase (NADH) small subunit
MKQATAMASADKTDWVEVCALDDLTPWDGSCALIEGRQIAIFRVSEGDDLYVIDNYDPIGKANVLSRGIVGDINGELVVASPLYKQHFSLKTGQCLEKADVQVATYPVNVVAGRVRVSIR